MINRVRILFVLAMAIAYGGNVQSKKDKGWNRGGPDRVNRRLRRALQEDRDMQFFLQGEHERRLQYANIRSVGRGSSSFYISKQDPLETQVDLTKILLREGFLIQANIDPELLKKVFPPAKREDIKKGGDVLLERTMHGQKKQLLQLASRATALISMGKKW